MGKLNLFSSLTKDQKIKLANNVYRETHLENKTIYKKDNIANCIYVLKDGGINIKKDDKIVSTMVKGDHLGVFLCTRTVFLSPCP